MQNSLNIVTIWLEKKRKFIFISSDLSLLLVLFFSIADAPLRLFPDSYQYIDLAKAPVSWESLFQMRPFFAILFFKIFTQDLSGFSFSCLLAYSLSLIYLLFTLFRVIKNIWLFFFSAFILGIFALHAEFTLWIKTALTESMSFALAFLSISLFINLLAKKNNFYYLFALTLVLIIRVNFRDAEALEVFVYFLCLVLVGLYERIAPIALTLALVSILSAIGFAFYSSTHAGKELTSTRSNLPMLNVFGKRMLLNPQFTNYLLKQGMPPSKSLDLLKDHYGWEFAATYFKTQDMLLFNSWLKEHGMSSYLKLLLKNPYYTFSPLWQQGNLLFHSKQNAVPWYQANNFHSLFFSTLPLLYIYILNLIAICLLYISLYPADKPRDVGFDGKPWGVEALGFGYFIACIPLALMVYHADSMEIARHALIVPIHALCAFALFTYLLDRKFKPSVKLCN